MDFATVRHCRRIAYILPAILTPEREAEDESMTRRENIAGKMVGFVGNLTVADVAWESSSVVVNIHMHG